MIFNYQYEDMLMHARKMNRMLPSLIDANNWDAVREISYVHPYIWDGQAAKAYNELANMLVTSHDRKIISLPNLIIEAAENMKKREETLANMARSILF